MPTKIENKGFTLLESDIELVATTITLAAPDAKQTHCFAGVSFYSDASGTPVVPSSGTVDITIETVNNEDTFEAVPAGTIQAATPLTVSWAANTKRVRATPNAVAGATHYRLRVTCNQS